MYCSHQRAGVCQSCYAAQAPKEAEPKEVSEIEEDTEASGNWLISIGGVLFIIGVIASVIKGFAILIGKS